MYQQHLSLRLLTGVVELRVVDATSTDGGDRVYQILSMAMKMMMLIVGHR